jgi:alpha-tubulin suppressor-like RCC1 family protein
MLVVASVLVVAACGDDTALPVQPSQPRFNSSQATAPEIEAQIKAFFPGNNSAAERRALGQFAPIKQLLTTPPVTAEKLKTARERTFPLLDFLGTQCENNQPDCTVEPAQTQVLQLRLGLLGFVGFPVPEIPADITSDDVAFALVTPAGTTITPPSGDFGLVVPPGAVSTTVAITGVKLPTPEDPGSGPLDFGEDGGPAQIPVFVDWTMSGAEQFNPGFPAQVLLCQVEEGEGNPFHPRHNHDGFEPPDGQDRFVIGHLLAGGVVEFLDAFEVAPPPGVTCDDTYAGLGGPPRSDWGRLEFARGGYDALAGAVGKYFGVKRAYAFNKLLGGHTSILSPFAILDMYPPVATVEITPSNDEPAVGDDIVFTAVARDQYGNLVERDISWQVDGEPATPDEGGNLVVTASEAGTITVEAISEGVRGTATITVEEVGPFSALDAIDSGERQSCAITHSGTAFCWGSNAFGQLGNGGSSDESVPTPISSTSTFAAISSTLAHSCALGTNGQVSCWGQNTNGELGDGTTTNRSTPVAVSGDISFKAVATGGSHTCALTQSGAAYCWGRNNNGQLGTGNTLSSNVPTPVAGGMSFTAISAGIFHTCGLTETGAAFCWGNGSFGQLGNGSTINRSSPTEVSTELTFTALTSGAAYTCGLTAEGDAYCWGSNHAGQLGFAPTGEGPSIPTAAVSGGFGFVALVASNENTVLAHTCGITAENAAYCWGGNSDGRIGSATSQMCMFAGTSTPCTTSPTLVSGGLSFKAVAPGLDHTCGITTADEAYCWGANSRGQLGNGTTTGSSTPIPVSKPTAPIP